jgi:superfamily I DNA and/or RNA helicase
MPETWRLAPDVCRYTSELFYAGKLKPLPSLAVQRLAETVEAVVKLVDQLIGGKWIDQDGKTCPLKPADLRVVAPYNAQVNRLAARLDPLGVPVGTVDKFQGQTCAAVIYSMATSSPEDAPRGMEFLYSLNRLNVATSRGRCATFIVASPALLEPQCRTPRQMQLANGLCRFVEMARQA